MASVIVSHLILLGRLVLGGWILLTCVLCGDCFELSFVHPACLCILSDNFPQLFPQLFHLLFSPVYVFCHLVSFLFFPQLFLIAVFFSCMMHNISSSHIVLVLLEWTHYVTVIISSLSNIPTDQTVVMVEVVLQSHCTSIWACQNVQ